MADFNKKAFSELPFSEWDTTAGVQRQKINICGRVLLRFSHAPQLQRHFIQNAGLSSTNPDTLRPPAPRSQYAVNTPPWTTDCRLYSRSGWRRRLMWCCGKVKISESSWVCVCAHYGGPKFSSRWINHCHRAEYKVLSDRSFVEQLGATQVLTDRTRTVMFCCGKLWGTDTLFLSGLGGGGGVQVLVDLWNR